MATISTLMTIHLVRLIESVAITADVPWPSVAVSRGRGSLGLDLVIVIDVARCARAHLVKSVTASSEIIVEKERVR